MAELYDTSFGRGDRPAPAKDARDEADRAGRSDGEPGTKMGEEDASPMTRGEYADRMRQGPPLEEGETTYNSDDDRRDFEAAAACEDDSPLAKSHPALQAVEGQPDPAQLSKGLSETSDRSSGGDASGTRKARAQDPHSADDEPSAEERARLHAMYQEYLNEHGAGRHHTPNTAANGPDVSPDETRELAPTGDELFKMDSDNLSSFQELRKKTYERADDIL
jgi:hypothetical protein